MAVIKRICYDKVSERRDFMNTFIIFVGGTIILSAVANRVNNYRLYKDLADGGYKLNLNKLVKIAKDIKTDDDTYNNQGVGIKKKFNFNRNYSKEAKIVAMFIPWLNIYIVSQKIKKYNENRDSIFERLRVLGVLEEMTLEEKKRYAKHPNGYVAYQIQRLPIPKKIENKIVVLTYKDSNCTGDVIYEIRNNLEDIHVLEVTGIIKDAYKDANNKDLDNKFKSILLEGINKYEGLEEFVAAINSGKEDIKFKYDPKLTASVTDTFTYFQNKEKLREEKLGVSKEIINLNQEMDATLFEILNELDSNSEKKVITYPINNIVWNISFTKVSGSLDDFPYSMQWKLIALVLRNAVIDTIRNWEDNPEFINHLDNEMEFSFEYGIGNDSNCTIKVTAKYYPFENKEIQEEFKKNIEKKSNAKFAKGVEELYQEENVSDLVIDDDIPKEENQYEQEGPKLVRKPKNE